MFNPNQQDVRNFFCDVYSKMLLQQQLAAIEKIAAQVISQHTEYHHILANRHKYVNYQWMPELGETNPFLHMSMHLALYEQLSIDQPHGICATYNTLCQQLQDEHQAQHVCIDGLAEMIYLAQKNNTAPDAAIYLSTLQRKVNNHGKS